MIWRRRRAPSSAEWRDMPLVYDVSPSALDGIRVTGTFHSVAWKLMSGGVLLPWGASAVGRDPGGSWLAPAPRLKAQCSLV